MASNSSSFMLITEPDDSLICMICLEVARDPWQHGECGVLFCMECILKYGRDKTCPHCRGKQPQYFQDNKSKREIRALRVRCGNAGRGCEWEGTVGTLDDHVTTVCQFTPVPCPNECKDGGETKHVMRRDLEGHLLKCPYRDHVCEYCGEEDTYVSITEEHYKVCLWMPVCCTNTGCTMTMERRKIPAHVGHVCKHTVVSCKYESIGCDVRMKRRDMGEHEEDDKVHLHKALETIVQLKKTMERLKNANDGLWGTTFQLKGTTKRLQRTMEKLVETSDLVEGRSNVCLNEKKARMIFKLTDYQKRRKENNCFTSPTFYTSPTGYHMFLEVYPNGCVATDGTKGMGTHLSIFVYVTKGKYDELLKWPFIGNVSVEILNQLKDKNHYKMDINFTVESDIRPDCKSNWGIPQFISLSKLSHDPATNTQYLKDNTLYFRVSVKVPNERPWLECTA